MNPTNAVWVNKSDMRRREANSPMCLQCFVTTVPTSGFAFGQPGLLRSYDVPPVAAPSLPDGHDWLIWQAARATSAARTYFPPLTISNKSQFEDAGPFGFNNPAALAVSEANVIPDFRKRPIGCIVSLGTGLQTLVVRNREREIDQPLEAELAGRTLVQKTIQMFKGIPTRLQDIYGRLETWKKDLIKTATNTEIPHHDLAGRYRYVAELYYVPTR